MQKISEKLPTHISYNLKKSFYLLSGKSLSCIKFLDLKYFKNGIQNPFKTLFHLINGRSHIIFTLGFCVEKNLNSLGDQKAKWKFWESHFIPSHLTFKSFKFHSISLSTTTSNQFYLFIITFQNLEFWDVTNLPHLKWISSSRFEKARKKSLGLGSPCNSIDHHEGPGATTLKINSCTTSIVLTTHFSSNFL